MKVSSLLVFAMAAATACGGASSAAASSPSSSKALLSRPHVVHPSVHRALRKQGSVNLIVTLADSTDEVIVRVKEEAFASRGHKIARLVDQLEAHAAQTQAPLLALVAKEASNSNGTAAKATSLWISNQVHIQDATFELVEKLSALPSVAEVREELILSLPTPVEHRPSARNGTSEAASSPLASEWGVTRVQAPAVWSTGVTGKGIVVAAIDTGVRYSHQALRPSFRGNYGWYDPQRKSKFPSDEDGHGTHVMGTIVGSGGIGVAPGAKWMACKGCTTRTKCPEAAVMECAQFILCPTDTAGRNKDCSKAPHVVNNSWGSEARDDVFYDKSIAAWLAAGIVPVFAIGNSGPGCRTVAYPGSHPSVIGVGATTYNNTLASFSSKGPARDGRVKPDLSAPGQAIQSAWITSDTSYNTIGGTSMAVPHVTGVVALALAAHPTWKFANVKAALLGSATTESLQATGTTCGGIPFGTFPDNNYGHGRVDAVGVVQYDPTKPRPPTPAPTSAPTPEPTTPPTPGPTSAPTLTPKPPVYDRCIGLDEVQCREMLCDWNATWGVCVTPV